ncbi:MAG: PspC domain-containing protein [Pseudomonadales bacterium]|jgi:phage shock protein PspC (stress-responsive transcriptional regulator)|nr:PspC domain-containing protein [Pseudomonadales bacterium]
MLKVVTANLNGNAYQVDEVGFEALHAYLEAARANLSHNPDCAEILTDLEQAIGDKCDTFLGQHKNVVSAHEMAQILKEMGPVESAPDPVARDGGESADSAAAASSAQQTPPAPIRRLFRLPDKGMLGGVCAGFAAYFNVDVVWVRLLFVLLTFLTGVWFFAWLVMLFVMPRAQTPEDVALAHGAPFNAQDVINRAKKKYDEYSVAAANAWHHRRVRHERAVKRPRGQVSYGAQVLAGISLPVLSTLSAALLVLFVALLLLLTSSSSVIGWIPGTWVPLWLALALLVVAYLVVAAPIGIVRRASRRYANGGSQFGWPSALDALLWLALVGVFSWAVYQFIPGVSDAVADLFGGATHTWFV